jgi:aldehyde:ferredoxin oxidoreductase
MPGGYMGKILLVNLTTSEIMEENLDEEICRQFLGGFGLGAHFLFDRQIRGVDPLGPGNILGFLTGPVTGTKVPFCGRFTVVAKSPLTGTWGDANSGGDFGPYLKFSGYDAVFFTGASEKPVYLFIDEGKAELKDAQFIWGKDTHDTEDLLKGSHGKDLRVACIGPAGEKISLISAIITNKGRAAGRSGIGAVMGSKNLKALAVRGKITVPVVQKERLDRLRKTHLPEMKKNPWYSFFHDIGTCAMIPGSVMNGRLPIKNWAGSILDMPDLEEISGENFVKRQEKRYGCWNCPMHCGGIMKEGQGEYKFAAGIHKPEYETIGAFGSMCLNGDPDSIIVANDICNRQGLDTISAGCTIAFAIECFENGIIGPKDTDGIELAWGNHRAIIALAEKMARREGFGDILADGARVAAETIGNGADQYAIHIKGQELPMHDPRAQIRLGLGATYKAAPAPARHTRASGEGEFRHPGLGEPPYDLDSFENRGGEQKRIMSLTNAATSAGFCLFGHITIPVDATHEFISCVTGWEIDFDELILIGERIANVQQAFNIREGLNPLEFHVPDRVYKTPPPNEGPLVGRHCDIDLLVRNWYREMDWDLHSGKPAKNKLVALGLQKVADVLY